MRTSVLIALLILALFATTECIVIQWKSQVRDGLTQTAQNIVSTNADNLKNHANNGIANLFGGLFGQKRRNPSQQQASEPTPESNGGRL